MDRVVVLAETLFKAVAPDARELAKALANEAEEFVVRAGLRAALDNHLAELDFLAFLEVDLHKLVHGFLEAQLKYMSVWERGMV